MGKNKDKKNIHYARDLSVYIILRTLVILVMILQLWNRNYENVFLCILTLILFSIPVLIDRRLNIKLPNTLEIIILLFIFSAEILGEVQNFYGIFKNWDTILHTINGFLCAAIGFSLIDILNRSKRFHTQLSPIFVTLVAICFSMTIGVLWEFVEYGVDNILLYDMQKDKIVQTVSSVKLNEDNKNVTVVIKDITKTVIYSLDENGEEVQTVIDGGYLDIGINDTMKDLLVNFIGAVGFSVIGYLYILDRDKYKFTERFLPVVKTEEEIERTQQELERLKKELEEKKARKNNKKKLAK